MTGPGGVAALADLVRVSTRVARSPARLEKIPLLAELLRGLAALLTRARRAFDGVQASSQYPAASHCASRACGATATTSAPRTATRSTPCARSTRRLDTVPDVVDASSVRAGGSPRPRWMTGMALFCLLTVAFLVPRDLFLAHTRDVEVWFGFELRGPWAWATAPLHWAIFAIGAWGFWRQRPWIVPAAAGYAFYVALSHLVWSEASPNGRGLAVGIAQAALFSIPGLLLLRAHRRQRSAAGGA